MGYHLTYSRIWAYTIFFWGMFKELGFVPDKMALGRSKGNSWFENLNILKIVNEAVVILAPEGGG